MRKSPERWTDEVEKDMKKIGIIYWHSVVRNWKNRGKCIGRQGPHQTVVIWRTRRREGRGGGGGEEGGGDGEKELQYTLFQGKPLYYGLV